MGANTLLFASYAYNTAFSETMNLNSGGNNGFSFREVYTPSVGGSLIRVTVTSGTAGSLVLDHLSVGTQTTTYNTSATPIELKFSGSSGCTVAASLVNLASDWTPFTTANGTNIVIVSDVNTSAGSSNISRLVVTSVSYYIAGATYNSASPGGSFTSDTTTNYIVSKIEVK